MKLFKEIEKCFPIIESHFSDDELNEFRQTEYNDLTKYHLGIGVWIRNEILQSGSPLYKHFVEQGVIHKDDMSSIILTCFYLHQRENCHNKREGAS